MNIRCKMGFHNWIYMGQQQTIQEGTKIVLRHMPKYRYCERCDRWEENYGIWSETYRQIDINNKKTKEVEGDGDNC